MAFRRTGTATVVITALVLVTAGCGSDDQGGGQEDKGGAAAATPTGTPKPDPEEIGKKVTEVVSSAKSVAIVADVERDGVKMHVESSGTMDGTNTRILTQHQGQTVEAVVVGGKTWMKLADAATAAKAGLPPAAVGKFFQVTPAQAKGLAASTPSAVLKDFTGQEPLFKSSGSVVEEATEQGQKAWLVKARSGGDGTTLVVSGDGKFEPLRLNPAGKGEVTFSLWNAVPPFKAPDKTQIYVP